MLVNLCERYPHSLVLIGRLRWSESSLVRLIMDKISPIMHDAFATHESGGTERDDKPKKETISERPWPDHKK